MAQTQYKDAELTRWRSGKLFVPGTVGVYQRRHRHGVISFSHWNGRMWGVTGLNAARAERARNQRSSWQDLPFRGLKEKTK